MKCNVGGTDRMIRIVAGVVIILLGFYFQSWWGAVGIVPILTGALRSDFPRAKRTENERKRSPGAACRPGFRQFENPAKACQYRNGKQSNLRRSCL